MDGIPVQEAADSILICLKMQKSIFSVNKVLELAWSNQNGLKLIDQAVAILAKEAEIGEIDYSSEYRNSTELQTLVEIIRGFPQSQKFSLIFLELS